MNEKVFDLEADGLKPTKIHCLSVTFGEEIQTTSDYNKIHSLFTSQEILVGHNIIRYDVPVVERLVGVKPNVTFIDTLALSWYLYPHRLKHGLESWGDIVGMPKVEISDWENLSPEEYKERCERDVEINKRIWKLFYGMLLEMYGTRKEVYRVCAYLTRKLYYARLAEERPWKLDVPLTRKNIATLLWLSRPKIKALKKEMPPVPQYRTMNKPKRMLKQDFSLTSVGERWYNECRRLGLNEDDTESIKVFVKDLPPNPSSSPQVKDWLFSLGWEPETFKTNAKGVEVPQLIKEDRSGLCESVLALDNEAVKELNGLFTINHRIATLRGFLKNQEDGYIKAEISGFTNTLRCKHSNVVNLPSVFSAFGEYIRPCLIAPEGFTQCGSDMSGLEDRTKQHYMIPYDPEYVKEMNVEGFDPHLDIGLSGGMLTQKDVDDYKEGLRHDELKPIRHGAKTTNYSCTYGAYPPKIAKSANMSLGEATKLWEAYWKRNWSIESIAKDAIVKEFRKSKWLWNPVSKMWYSLRKEKDRFSTLNQGTGSYAFDVWIGFVVQETNMLSAQFHDEGVWFIKEEQKEEFSKILKQAIKDTNKYLEMKRDLDIDIQFGNSYGDIH